MWGYSGDLWDGAIDFVLKDIRGDGVKGLVGALRKCELRPCEDGLGVKFRHFWSRERWGNQQCQGGLKTGKRPKELKHAGGAVEELRRLEVAPIWNVEVPKVAQGIKRDREEGYDSPPDRDLSEGNVCVGALSDCELDDEACCRVDMARADIEVLVNVDIDNFAHVRTNLNRPTALNGGEALKDEEDHTKGATMGSLVQVEPKNVMAVES
jgi:hypothetical protein